MNPGRFHDLTAKYASLTIVVVGDFCLDLYLEIDPSKGETSIETGLPVHNVTRVRAQPGASGTILNNLVALGVGTVFPIGFAGADGNGFELHRALSAAPGARMDGFVQTSVRNTFTYCKPLLIHPGKPPQELNRLDTKNWSPTPEVVQHELRSRLEHCATRADAVIVLDQVDLASTGVVTPMLLDALHGLQRTRRDLLILADSRRGLADFPPLTFKMNAAELGAMTSLPLSATLEQIKAAASALAARNQRSVFISLSERGILGASPDGAVEHVEALPVHGEIDVVGAGDSVSANLATALASGANLREALELANAAASVVVHKLGTTGTASVPELQQALSL